MRFQAERAGVVFLEEFVPDLVVTGYLHGLRHGVGAGDGAGIEVGWGWLVLLAWGMGEVGSF